MKIAIFGSTSHIAKDLISCLLGKQNIKLFLFTRQLIEYNKNNYDNHYVLNTYDNFDKLENYDIIINFIGVSDPLKIITLGKGIIDTTLYYDNMILNYLKHHPACKYIFISSGAVYGGDFCSPVNGKSKAQFDINNFGNLNWYQLAKLLAEISHRMYNDLNIIDLRVFNYFSANVNLSANFFVCDILRSILNRDTFKTTPDNIFRDYLCKEDFYQIINKIFLYNKKINIALDCYSKEVTDKFSILNKMRDKFNFDYLIENRSESKPQNNWIVEDAEVKRKYYSMNKIAKTIGYLPSKTSLECIVDESISIIDRVQQTEE